MTLTVPPTSQTNHAHCLTCYKPSDCKQAKSTPEVRLTSLFKTFAASFYSSDGNTPLKCPIVKCRHYPTCNFQFHDCKADEHYESTCQESLVSCLNANYGCPVRIPRRDISWHLGQCPASIVHCSYKWVRKLLPQYTRMYKVITTSTTKSRLNSRRGTPYSLSNSDFGSNSPTHHDLDITCSCCKSNQPNLNISRDGALNVNDDTDDSGIGAGPCNSSWENTTALSIQLPKQMSLNPIYQPLLRQNFANFVIDLAQPLELSNFNCAASKEEICLSPSLSLSQELMVRDQLRYVAKHPEFLDKIISCMRVNLLDRNTFDLTNNQVNSIAFNPTPKSTSSNFNNSRNILDNQAKASGSKFSTKQRSHSYFDFVMLKRSEDESKAALAHSKHRRGLSLKAPDPQSTIQMRRPIAKKNSHLQPCNSGAAPARPNSYPQVLNIGTQSNLNSNSNSKVPTNLLENTNSTITPISPNPYYLMPSHLLDNILKCRNIISSLGHSKPLFHRRSTLCKANQFSPSLTIDNYHLNLVKDQNNTELDDEIKLKLNVNKVDHEDMTKLNATELNPSQPPSLRIDGSISSNTIESFLHYPMSTLPHKCSTNIKNSINSTPSTNTSNQDLSAIKMPMFQFYDKRIHSYARYYFDPDSVHYFTCGQCVRRDQFPWHYLNVHAEIENYLDDWLIHRCPLSASLESASLITTRPNSQQSPDLLNACNHQCNFAVPRWLPSISSTYNDSQVGDIVYDRHCNVVTFRSLSPTTLDPIVFGKTLKLNDSPQNNSPAGSSNPSKNMLKNKSIIDSLPPEAIYRLFAYLAPLDLINLSLTCRQFHAIVHSSPLLQSKAMIVCEWERCKNTNTDNRKNVFDVENVYLNNLNIALPTKSFKAQSSHFDSLHKDGPSRLPNKYEGTRWKITSYKWVYPKTFSPIKAWIMNPINTSGVISNHLKTCPLNDINIKTKPYLLPSLDNNSAPLTSLKPASDEIFR